MKVRANKQNWWAFGFLREEPFESRSCYCETENTGYIGLWMGLCIHLAWPLRRGARDEVGELYVNTQP